MEATEYDQQKLYKLIRKQRGGKGPANVKLTSIATMFLRMSWSARSRLSIMKI